MLRLALALVILALPAQPVARRETVDDGYRSTALRGELRFAAYLPPGYVTSGRRYPVVYFLHGLPASPGAYRGLAFVAQALEQIHRNAIVIAAPGRPRARAGSRVPRPRPGTQLGDGDRRGAAALRR